MTLQDFIALAAEYNRLGGAVQDQLVAVVETGESLDDQNSNALRMIADFLHTTDLEEADEFAGIIDDHLATGHEGI